jgi:hypothetical protein
MSKCKAVVGRVAVASVTPVVVLGTTFFIEDTRTTLGAGEDAERVGEGGDGTMEEG